MLKYQHYSFDLWLTLIRSNPLFKQERTAFFHQHFNIQHKTIEEVAAVFRQVDLMCNAVNEKTGKNIDADEMYLVVINLINDGVFPLQEIELNKLEQEMENLLFAHLPFVYCSQTLNALEKIYQSGSTISILSNTGFIRGKTLRKVLSQLKLDIYLNFQLYSDEVGLSKPNPKFFKLMLNEVAILKSPAEIALDKIIHIGDNEIADVKGASAVGIESLLINSNKKCISNLFN